MNASSMGVVSEFCQRRPKDVKNLHCIFENEFYLD